MPEPGTPTIEQLKVLLTVVKAGSFTAAAKRLGRAVSTVSYTIGQLEQQLGVSLFDREQSRTPRLTEAGSAVLSKARVVAVGIDDLRASVRALLKGIEAEVALVVDVMLPSARLVDAAQAFETTFPTVIPVAAPSHPLARGRPNASGAAHNHRQLVLTVRTPFSEGPDVGIFSADVWRLADLGAKHAVLLAGVGWGNMPEPNVRADLAAGRLVRLELPEARNALYPLRALHRTDEPPGPAAAWLIQRSSIKSADFENPSALNLNPAVS
jgi:DNA-binding transcriptional LysR family regulator